MPPRCCPTFGEWAKAHDYSTNKWLDSRINLYHIWADGELEHGALSHVPGGYAMREKLGGAKLFVPSAKKVAGPGARFDLLITHINASYVCSHFDATEVGLPDAPRAREIVYALVTTTGGRVHARVGRLRADEIKGEDGLR